MSTLNKQKKKINKRKRKNKTLKTQVKILNKENQIISNQKNLVKRANQPNNKLLHMLIDPEDAPLDSYPDENSRLSAVIRPIINVSIPFIKNDYGSTPKGTFLMWAFPSYNTPLYMLQETLDFETPVQPVSIVLNNADVNGGLYPIGDTGAYSEENLFLSNEYRNLDAHWNLTTLFPDAQIPMFKGSNSNGEFFGIPGLGCKYTSNMYQGQLAIVFEREVSNTHHIWYKIIDKTGTLKELEVTPNNGVFAVNINSIFTDLDGDIGFPGVGIQLKMVDTGGGGVVKWPISSVTLRAYLGEQAVGNGVNTICLTPTEFPDVNVINNLVTNYRTIGMSMLNTFTGSLVASAGQITSYFYEGGASPGYESFYAYDNIANITGAYTGAAAQGSYTWWSPADKESMNFRSINSTQDFHSPYIVSSGIFQDLTNTNVGIRLRLVMIIEIISKSQLFTYNRSRVSPLEIAQASAMVSELPHSMCNPNHLEKIRNFLRSAGQVALKIGKTFYDNWDVFKPAALKLAALAL